MVEKNPNSLANEIIGTAVAIALGVGGLVALVVAAVGNELKKGTKDGDEKKDEDAGSELDPEPEPKPRTKSRGRPRKRPEPEPEPGDSEAPAAAAAEEEGAGVAEDGGQ